MYHNVAMPWLQVKILRLLQQFPIPPTEAMRTRLNDILLHILNKTEVVRVNALSVLGCSARQCSPARRPFLSPRKTKNVNRNNAEHCVLFEAVDLIIKQNDLSLSDLRSKAIAHLSKFINIREPNIVSAPSTSAPSFPPRPFFIIPHRRPSSALPRSRGHVAHARSRRLR